MNDKNFSNWVKWENRNGLNGLQFSGVYCIAISIHDLSNQVFQWISDIKYVGMTNSRKGIIPITF